MVQKVLIVGSDPVQATIVAGMLGIAADNVFCIAVPHAMALSEFLSERPDAVVVCDYDEAGSLVKGFQTYHEIKEMCAAYQLVVRVGYEAHPYHDYMKLPKIYGPFGCGGFFEIFGERSS